MVSNNNDLDVDNLISRMTADKCKKGTAPNIKESEVKELCIRSKQIFMEQDMCLQLMAPVTIVGDIHG